MPKDSQRTPQPHFFKLRTAQSTSPYNSFYYKANHVSACPFLFISHGAMCINVKKLGKKYHWIRQITSRLSSSDGVQIGYKSKFTLGRVETPKNPWINPDKSLAKFFIIFSHCPCNAVQFTSVQKYQNIRIVPERESSQTANIEYARYKVPDVLVIFSRQGLMVQW